MNIIYLCCNAPIPHETDWLSIFGSLANIIIALLTFILGWYVFIYQREKDNENKIETQQLHRKNIKLQWFKEIIIQPKIQLMFDFFEALQALKTMLNKSDIDENEKIEIINYIKLEQSKLRKGFLDLIQNVDVELYNMLAINIDSLTDHLTNCVSNDEYKLNNIKTYEREINSQILASYNDVLSKIFNYCG
jgi:hypothetical protein